MRNPPGGNQVDAGGCDRRCRLNRYPSGRFRHGPSTNPPHSFGESVRAHVIEKDRIGADVQDFVELVEGIDFDLDLDEVSHSRPSSLQGWTDATGNGDTVILYQNGIIGPKAMVGSASGSHRVLLDQAEPRRRLARADGPGPRP